MNIYPRVDLERGVSEATLAMLQELGDTYGGQQASSDGVSAGYRGQIGRNAAIPHTFAGNIVFAWLLTLPAAAAIGALAYGLTRVFGTGALGPVVVTLAGLALIVAVFTRRAERGAPVAASSG